MFSGNASIFQKVYFHVFASQVLQSGIPNAHEIVLENMAAALDLIFLDVEVIWPSCTHHQDVFLSELLAYMNLSCEMHSNFSGPVYLLTLSQSFEKAI
jgi:hypothetical protein